MGTGEAGLTLDAVGVDSAPRTGSVLRSRYRLERELGRGGSAVVYRAIDLVLDEPVAVKVLLLDGFLGQLDARAACASFRAEAVAAMRLGHPRIVTVRHYDVEPPFEFLVMELVEGEALSSYRVRQPSGRLVLDEVLDAGLQCLDALVYSHGAGVVHHDLKPSNILRVDSDGSIKLCDFGLAARTAAPSTVLRQGYVCGTPAFMSPERILGAPGDARSDLYSLAAALYELGHGSPLFDEGDAAVRGHVREVAPRSPYLPRALGDVLARALEKDPDARWATASAMRSALAAAARACSALESDESIECHGSDRDRVDTDSIDIIDVTDLIEDDAEEGLEVTDSMIVRGGESSAHELRRALDGRDGRCVMCVVPAATLRSAYGGTFEVAGFLLDELPVTCAQYERYLVHSDVDAPSHWLGRRAPHDQRDHPVTGVTLEDACCYAAWRGVRLPTSLEWELAARGAEGRAYPWGEHFDGSLCHALESGARRTAAVAAHAEGASSCGCLDLIGNVWEWTALDGRAPTEPGCAWVLGGSYRHPCGGGGVPRASVGVAKAYRYVGFRCARDGAAQRGGDGPR